MSISRLMLRNLRKNLSNYYLYVFALIFSTALYFAFVTLQFDPAMDPVQGSVKGAASIKVASVLLVAIVAIFLLYANTIFIKRRSKEIGLFQLIGMTKNRIFRILAVENLILYAGSLLLGIFAGFSVSKLMIMVFFKIIGVDANATLHWSFQAFVQTLIVFLAVYILIMLMNYAFIQRQTILSLFRVKSVTEGKVRQVSALEMIVGIVGMLLIVLGYTVSSKLFSGDFKTINELLLAMLVILGSVIIGTYLFYRGSVRFIFNLIRKKKNGYLNMNEVLSLSSLMFRIKSNAALLTIITTVSALAIGLLSLSYISYYSAEKAARNYVPDDFSITDARAAERFEAALNANQIKYTETKIDVIQATVNIQPIVAKSLNSLNLNFSALVIPVISERAVAGVELAEDEIQFSGLSMVTRNLSQFKSSGPVELKSQHEAMTQNYQETGIDAPISEYFTHGNLPVAIVDQTVFERLKKDMDPAIQRDSSLYIGIDINHAADRKEANAIYQKLGFKSSDHAYQSYLEMSSYQRETAGLTMFIVGFLGLTFLITSGCILYFKQMDESEDEKSSYTILRKLGFTQGDLVTGIKVKQLFNFGIPLAVGLLHSYFAVRSSWFLFGTTLWTPMIIVMVLYTILYSVSGLLSVIHYKKVIKDAL